MRRRRNFFVACGAFLAAAPLTAQAAPQAPPPPGTACDAIAEAHRFDFWVGRWRVTPAVTDTLVVGQSEVQRVSGGCALLENWHAARGYEGKSLNAYNRDLGEWQQFWVGDPGGTTPYLESHWEGATLVFLSRADSVVNRLSFTPLDDSTVRQFGQRSVNGGKTWIAQYDFHYHRVR